MKKKLLLIAIMIIPFFIKAQETKEFAPIGAEWYYTNSDGTLEDIRFNHIVSERDTTVDGDICRVLQLKQYHFTNELIDSRETYIIKQEQGKVYYYYQDKFNLMFDFSTEVNDTIEFTFRYQIGDSTGLNVLKDTTLSAKFVIEDITTDMQGLKTFITKVLEEDEYIFQDVSLLSPTFPYIYTERIGLHGEFLPILDDMAHPNWEYYRWLRCYTDADISFVSDRWATMSQPCDYPITTGVNTFQIENDKVYPNPFSDHISVFTDHGGNIEIIDIVGKTIYQSTLMPGVNNISTNHFSTGVFFIKIQNKENSVQNFKVVKL